MRYELHGGSLSDITWAANNGINALGLIVPADGTYADTLAEIQAAGVNRAITQPGTVMEATINIFNNGEGTIGSNGLEYEALIQDIAAAGWDTIAGDSVSGDVVNTVRKYTPFINLSGDIGGYQLQAYAPPYSHPVDGDYTNYDYVRTFAIHTDGTAIVTKDSVLHNLAAAADATSDRFGIVIDNSVPDVTGTWIDIISAAADQGTPIDTIVFSYNPGDIIAAVTVGVLATVFAELQATYPPEIAVVAPVIGQIPTNITISCTGCSSLLINAPFTLSGQLTSLSVGLGDKAVDILRSNTRLTTVPVDNSGNYAWTDPGESVAGTYPFSAAFVGDWQYTDSSASVDVNIGTPTYTCWDGSVVTDPSKCPVKPTPIATGTHPNITSWGSNTLDVAYTGTNNTVYHKHYNGSTWAANWDGMGGTTYEAPAIFAPNSGELVILTEGTETPSQCWQRSFYSGAWHAWSSLGGSLYPGVGPSGSSYGGDVQDIYIVGGSRALWHKRYIPGSGYSTWRTDISVACYSDLSATSPDSAHFSIFFRNSGGGITQAFYSGAWGQANVSCPTMLGGTGPGVCSWGSTYHLFINSGNGLYHAVNKGAGWSAWENIGGMITSSPSAVILGNTIHVVARGNDKHCWMVSGNTGAWGNWQDLGGLIL